VNSIDSKYLHFQGDVFKDQGYRNVSMRSHSDQWITVEDCLVRLV